MTAAEEKLLTGQLQSPEQQRQAFDQVVRKYQRVLYYHIRRLVVSHDDADDVLQNTLLKAWKNLGSFRGDASVKTWLYRIATNESLTYLEQKKRRYHQDVEGLENDLRHSLQGGAYINGDELQLKLHNAILTLPDRQRAVFNMRYFDEMKYEEIADVLGVTVGALKASYHHAAHKIEAFITAS